MTDSSHTILRKSAAEILDISLRTLDRYVRKNNLTAVRRGRELYFEGKEIMKLKAELKGNTKEASQNSDFDEVEKARKKEEAEAMAAEPLDELDVGFAKIRDELLRRSPEEGIFKALFEKNDQELKETRKKLDMATFRLGSLEAQLKSMVPLIEYRKKKEELLQLADRASIQQKDLKTLHDKLKSEILIRRIYAGFLFFMMGLLPLLLILRLVSGL